MRYLLLALAACGTVGTHAGHAHRPTDGAITGLARDGDTADPLGAADLHVERQGTTAKAAVSGRDGVYLLDHLAPGSYTLIGAYAGQTIKTTNVVVDAGEASYVDVSFTPGRPVPYTIDYTDPKLSEIRRFRPKNGATLIEGTVSDTSSRTRVAGAVVTAFGPTDATGATTGDTLQTISGDDGRFKFDGVTPGVYVVSAYYSVGGRGQIEVRRSDIHVNTGDIVDVPLWIETARN